MTPAPTPRDELAKELAKYWENHPNSGSWIDLILARDRQVRGAEREKVAKWMISLSFATGHGDTIEDLLKEASWQVKELYDNRLKAGGIKP